LPRKPIYDKIVRKPIFLLVDVEFKKDLERLATVKRMTLSSLIQSASMDYLRREVMGMAKEMEPSVEDNLLQRVGVDKSK
jgi:hypothetical protein